MRFLSSSGSSIRFGMRLVRRLKRHLQRHCGHARHVGDLCEGRRIRIPRAVLHSKDRVTRSACLRGDFEFECWVAGLLCGGGRHSKQDERNVSAYRLPFQTLAKR